MSHFCVAVILKNTTDLAAALRVALQPFHEFECTGEVDDYVVNVDITDELRAEYESATVTRITLPDGREVAKYADELYRAPTADELARIGRTIGGEGSIDGILYRTIDGAVRVYDTTNCKSDTYPVSDSKTFTEYVIGETGKPVIGPDVVPDLHNVHKWGWIRVNADGVATEVIRRTNPNCKWDWWVVGGRWPNKLLDKSGNRGNICRRDSLDLDGMRGAAQIRADREYTEIEQVFGGLEWPPKPWKVFRADFDDIEKARAAYGAYPAMQAYAALDFKHPLKLLFGDPADVYNKTREQYVAGEVEREGVPFAVLKDGTWYEKGKTGWFGVVADEKDQGVWNRQYQALLDSLDPDDVVARVDCHI